MTPQVVAELGLECGFLASFPVFTFPGQQGQMWGQCKVSGSVGPALKSRQARRSSKIQGLGAPAGCRLTALPLPSFARYTKPLTFADCISDELPLGWEEAYDPQVGDYFIDHNTSKFLASLPSPSPLPIPLPPPDPPSLEELPAEVLEASLCFVYYRVT